jgi:hypothetical protein
MTTEMIFSAAILILGIGFMYQYGRRLWAETKLHELEKDVDGIVEVIQNDNNVHLDSVKKDNHTKTGYILSEYVKIRLATKK